MDDPRGATRVSTTGQAGPAACGRFHFDLGRTREKSGDNDALNRLFARFLPLAAPVGERPPATLDAAT